MSLTGHCSICSIPISYLLLPFHISIAFYKGRTRFYVANLSFPLENETPTNIIPIMKYLVLFTHPITLIILFLILLECPTGCTNTTLPYICTIINLFFLFWVTAFSWATSLYLKGKVALLQESSQHGPHYFLETVITSSFKISLTFACRLQIQGCMCICKLVCFRLSSSTEYTQSHMKIFIFTFIPGKNRCQYMGSYRS